MEQSYQKLGEIFETSPMLVALYDQFDRLRFANRTFREAWHIGSNEDLSWSDIMRRNFATQRGTVVHSDDIEAWLNSTRSRRGKVRYKSYETDLADGRWLWMQEETTDDGWMLCVASDITDLHAETRALRQDRDTALKASFTDELTGVANRRFVMSRVDEMLAWSVAETTRPGCLAILDIDNFKAINDLHGHHVGDQILQGFAHAVNLNVRRTDCFGRVGGEEFVIVMPRTSSIAALLILERILVLVRSLTPLPSRPDFFCTFSAGVAQIEGDDVALSLYARADKALYAAKTLGRNQIVSFDSLSQRAVV
ncbi:MAG TPA: diguanylate cyclase [Ensifer sp.]|jgi:diguanylate cyclase (GGDEF)-like protein|uniref:sensor domain-containing diguanylate cyclase n=1 Tax=Ensifer sp. TaxID=1872086 RepID=UPI002E0E724D|nr:diguanylate cyclase [Ensifer sp.]